MKNFKLQSWKIKLEKWYEPSNKSEITGFYMGKSSKFPPSFSWDCFMRHRLQWFLWCYVWSPYFFYRTFCDRPCLYQLLKQIRWFTSTNPKKLTAFSSLPSLSLSLPLSLFLSLSLIMGNSLPNSCVTDGCWFSSIRHFAMFTKSISDCTIFFGAFSLLIILE